MFVFRSATTGREVVAGHLSEYSLSVDHLFVVLLILSRFAVPALAAAQAYQPRAPVPAAHDEDISVGR